MAIGVGGGNLTPGVSTFGTLKRKVANYVQAPNDSDILDAAGCAINDGINVLNSRTWNWNLREQSFTWVASTATYSVNANFKKARALHILDSSSNVVGRIDFNEPKTFVDMNTFTSSDGNPEQYSIIKAKQDLLLTLDPTPSSAWVSLYPTGTLYYFSRILHASGDADVIDIVPEAEPFLLWYAREDLSAQYGEPAMSDRALRKQQMIWSNLVRDDNRDQTDWVHDENY